jgi:hypothetical protein
VSIDFKNLSEPQEQLLQRILEIGEYLRFATRNQVTSDVIVSQAGLLGMFVDDLKQPPKPSKK